jgi:hypothetical protein
MTISCAWKIWAERKSAPTTQDKFHLKICFFTITHTAKNCHVHLKIFYLFSHQQIQRVQPPKKWICPFYTTDFRLVVVFNGI